MNNLEILNIEYKKLENNPNTSTHTNTKEAVDIQDKLKLNFSDPKEMDLILESLKNYGFYCHNDKYDLIDCRPLILVSETEKAWCIKTLTTKPNTWIPKSKCCKISHQSDDYYYFIIDMKFIRNNDIDLDI